MFLKFEDFSSKLDESNSQENNERSFQVNEGQFRFKNSDDTFSNWYNITETESYADVTLSENEKIMIDNHIQEHEELIVNVNNILESITDEEVNTLLESEGILMNEGAYELDITSDGVKGKTFFIKINGKEYGYTPAGGNTMDKIASTFEAMLKHSHGKALAWLKKNSTLVQGSVQGGQSLATKLKAAMVGESEEDILEAVSILKAEYIKED